MEKKKFTSWGVSFASLALVAGMMSYLGITNKDNTNKTNTVARAQIITQSSDQQSQNNNISYELPAQTGNNSSEQSNSQSSSIDHSFSSQHRNFDTTTGGT